MTAPSLAPAWAEASEERDRLIEANTRLIAENAHLTNLLSDQNAKVTALQNKFVDNRPKLTQKEVTVIRQMYRHGLSQRVIADIYDVNPATISRTVRGVYH